MSPLDLALLLALGVIWGASFLFIRVAAPEFGPLPLMGARVVIAGAALVLYVAATRQRVEVRERFGRFLILGLVGAALPFALIATAELRLTASVSSILNSTSPLFTVVVGWMWLRHPLRRAQIIGSVIGIAGVAILVGLEPVALDVGFVLAVAASLGGALSYGIAANYASRALRDSRPLETAVGQQFGAAVWLVPGALVTLPSAPPGANALLSLLALALLSTTFAYLIYYRLIARAGPTRAIAVTFLIPIFGTILGAAFLGEPLGVGLVLGLVVILVGVALVLGLLPGQRGAASSDSAQAAAESSRASSPTPPTS